MRTTLETYRGMIYPWHCDHMGHMNVMWYVGKFDEATWNLFAQLGLTPSYLRSSNCGMAAVRQSLEYKKELLAGDPVVVQSQLLRAGKSSMAWTHVMRDVETLSVAAICEMTGVHIDRTTRRAHPLPPDVVARTRELSGK